MTVSAFCIEKEIDMRKYTIQVNIIGKPLFIKSAMYNLTQKATHDIEKAYFGDLEEIEKINKKIHGHILVFDDETEELYEYEKKDAENAFANKLKNAFVKFKERSSQ